MENQINNDITAIILNEEWTLTQKSDKIMERLRGESIFIPTSYNDELEKKQLKNKKEPCTIDPDECLPVTLEQIETGSLVESTIKFFEQGVINIKGNSFGPFAPEDYFKSDLKILWILKESFIEGPSYAAGDRGAHNQAAEYAHSFFKHGNLGPHNETHPQVLELTKRILTSLGELSIDNKNHERNVSKDVMKHICVLEVNHFPGLAFNSKKSNDVLIRKWAEKNAMILKELIKFYKPNILIGGFTIGHFYNISDHGLNSLKNSIDNGNHELLSKLGINVCCVEQPINSSSYVFKASLDSNNEPIYVIDAYHPNRYKLKDAEVDAKLINIWRTKENGMI